MVSREVYADVRTKLEGYGVEINDVDGTPFRAMVNPVYEQFGAEWGKEFVDGVRKAAAGE